MSSQGPSAFGEKKPDPKIETSLKYIANYQKFQMKEDLAEVLKPLIVAIEDVTTAILRGQNGCQ